jgi:serine/threonine protein kinase
VAELHEREIIHRDIKASNVLLDRDGRVFVTDFGLTCPQRLGRDGPSFPSIGGTVPYMAPEMFDGQVSARRDVYALGITTFELLTGRVPFLGTFDQIRDQHRSAPLPVEALHERQGAPALVEVLERATHKDAMFRYKTAAH